MLLGKYEVVLDKAGRVTVPLAHRRHLGEDLVVCRSYPPERYLMVFDSESYQKFLANAAPHDPVTETECGQRRWVTGNAFEVRLDKAGRILLPQELRESSGIDGLAMAVGNLDRIDLYSMPDYEAWMKEMASPEGIAANQQLREMQSARMSAR